MQRVTDAVRCAIEVQNGLIERNAGLPPKRSAGVNAFSAPALALGIAALLVLIAAGAWYLLAGNRAAPIASNAPTDAAHLSIVVLPFANLSGDASQDYFADGITENLTTDLSRIRNSFVIARNTAFTYKGKTIDAKEIGKELGVRYVLEGSVQRDQNRVRVNAQLIDAESGAHLWADRFEEDVAAARASRPATTATDGRLLLRLLPGILFAVDTLALALKEERAMCFPSSRCRRSRDGSPYCQLLGWRA
jgi:TolB-like protein